MDVTGLQIHPATKLVYILASGKLFKMISNNSTDMELACSSNVTIYKFEIDYQGEIYGFKSLEIYKCIGFSWTIVYNDEPCKAMSFKGKEKYSRRGTKTWKQINLETGKR